MTKQEIEKAIKNDESMWYVFRGGVCELNTKEHTDIYVDRDGFYNCINEYGYKRYYQANRLFKTRAEAEHYAFHEDITRIETLPFLTWEEFLEKKEIIFTTKKYEMVMLGILNNKLILAIRGKSSYDYWDLTEANFYKAYDECVRLFKGKE